MKRIVAALLTVACLSVPQFCDAKAIAPTKVSGAAMYSRSDNEFAAAIVVDQKSGEVLYEYHADDVRSAASLTKLMGALVFMDHAPDWNKVVDIRAQDEVGGGRLRVASGATMKVIDLLYSSITASANNAAVALARITGVGQLNFIKEMNKKASVLGLTNTHFVDSSGMDPKNVTTARDMAKLAATAYSVDSIRKVATTSSYTFKVRNTGELHKIKNTNDILTSSSYDAFYVTGGKTGFLYESMYNLAVRVRPSADKQDTRQLMVVVLGSQTREASFKSGAALANWAWKAYKW